MADWHRLDRQSFALLFTRRSSSLQRQHPRPRRRNRISSLPLLFFPRMKPRNQCSMGLLVTGLVVSLNSVRVPRWHMIQPLRRIMTHIEPSEMSHLFILGVGKLHSTTLASMLWGNFRGSSCAQAVYDPTTKTDHGCDPSLFGKDIFLSLV